MVMSKSKGVREGAVKGQGNDETGAVKSQGEVNGEVKCEDEAKVHDAAAGPSDFKMRIFDGASLLQKSDSPSLSSTFGKFPKVNDGNDQPMQ